MSRDSSLKPGPREGKHRFLISFINASKGLVDNAHFQGTRDDARRRAVELYLKSGDTGPYAGFVVTLEEHGGF